MDDPFPTARRARWLALVRFRRTATVIGTTRAGEPVIEVAGVRMALCDTDGRPFRPIVACALCHQEVPSPAERLTRPEDLPRPRAAVICATCSRPRRDHLQPPDP